LITESRAQGENRGKRKRECLERKVLVRVLVGKSQVKGSVCKLFDMEIKDSDHKKRTPKKKKGGTLQTALGERGVELTDIKNGQHEVVRNAREEN